MKKNKETEWGTPENVQFLDGLNATVYDSNGTELLCSTPNCDNKVVGAIMGESYFINFCREHRA
ncbi:MAG: hypothetical protein ACHQVS_00710 [Candidatus Babeliales bacterium]